MEGNFFKSWQKEIEKRINSEKKMSLESLFPILLEEDLVLPNKPNSPNN